MMVACNAFNAIICDSQELPGVRERGMGEEEDEAFHPLRRAGQRNIQMMVTMLHDATRFYNNPSS